MVFYVMGKPKLSNRFEGKIEVIDLNDLLNIIMTGTVEIKEKIISLLRRVDDQMVFNKKVSVNRTDENFIPDSITYINKNANTRTFTGQLSRVRIEAFIPLSPSEKTCRKIDFARRDSLGIDITFNHEVVINILFARYKESLEKRIFVAAIDKDCDFLAIQLPNCRIYVDIDTGEQLCQLLDEYYDEFLRAKKELAGIFGLEKFSIPPDDNWNQPLMQIPTNIWGDMKDFSQEHCEYERKEEWCIFDSTAPSYIIRIVKNRNSQYREGILVELLGEITDNICTVYWKRGYAFNCNERNGFNNQNKWKADYTLNWIVSQWLPHIYEVLYNQKFTGIAGLISRIKTPFTPLTSKHDFIQSNLSTVISYLN